MTLLEILVFVVVVLAGAAFIQPIIARAIHLQRKKLLELSYDEDRVELEKRAIDLALKKKREDDAIEAYRRDRLEPPDSC